MPDAPHHTDYDTIAQLWAELNRTCQVEGCWIDGDNVHLSIRYRYIDSYDGLDKYHPIELCIGGDPKAVIQALRQAIQRPERA